MKMLGLYKELEKNRHKNMEYVKSKINEISDLFDDLNCEVKSDIVIEDDIKTLDIDIIYNKVLLNIELDIDNLNLGIYSNFKKIYWVGKTESLDEAMDKIKNSIFKYLNVTP